MNRKWIIPGLVLILLVVLYIVIDHSGKPSIEPPDQTTPLSVTTDKIPYFSFGPQPSSGVEIPEEAVLKESQKEVFGDLSPLGAKKVSLLLDDLHGYLGSICINEERLVNPENPAWVFWEETGVIAIEGFTESMLNEVSGDTLIEWLNDIKSVIENEAFKEDIEMAQTAIKYAVDNHDYKGFFVAHMIVHDLDYFVTSYPVYDASREQTDLCEIDVYFGVTKTLEGHSPDYFAEFAKDMVIAPNISSEFHDRITQSDEKIERIRREFSERGIMGEVEPFLALLNDHLTNSFVNVRETYGIHTDWSLVESRDLPKLLRISEYLKSIISNEEILMDLDLFQRALEKGVAEREMSFILYAHMIAHDLDCWLIGNGRPIDSDLYFGATITIEGHENAVYTVYREFLD